MSTKRTDELGYRIAAVAFALGASLMAVAGLSDGRPEFLVSAVLQAVAWFCFVTAANRIEASRAQLAGTSDEPVGD